MDLHRQRVVVGMSGGVDSSVTALLLAERGYEVIGATLLLQSCQGTGESAACCPADGASQARAVAGQLGLPHHVLDCRREFAEQVLRPCWQEYARGRTPNPCVLCNQRIKFGALLDFARSLGAERVATGHYAVLDEEAGSPVLRRGADPRKDQSYFLFSLDKAQLASAMMPLGGFTKAAVRERARREGLLAAERRESQDICILEPDVSFGESLFRWFSGTPQPGEVVDSKGQVLGRHDGVHRFTIGQRRGVGIALGTPAWVKSIDATTGRVTLTVSEQDLLASGLRASGVVWHEDPPDGGPLSCQVQTRYRQTAVAAEVEAGTDGTATVRFAKPIRAVTPGQAAVFYRDDRLIGGGWIDEVLADPPQASM